MIQFHNRSAGLCGTTERAYGDMIPVIPPSFVSNWTLMRRFCHDFRVGVGRANLASEEKVYSHTMKKCDGRRGLTRTSAVPWASANSGSESGDGRNVRHDTLESILLSVVSFQQDPACDLHSALSSPTHSITKVSYEACTAFTEQMPLAPCKAKRTN